MGSKITIGMLAKKRKKSATDRGFYSSENEEYSAKEGLRVSMPKIGKKNKERQCNRENTLV